MSDLPLLIERTEALTGPVDAVTAGGLANSFSPWTPNDPEWRLFVTALGGTLEAVGAALALTERMLPGWRRMMQEGNAYDNGIYQAHSGCTLYHPLSSGAPTVKGFAPTLPLAILAALLRALQEQK